MTMMRKMETEMKTIMKVVVKIRIDVNKFQGHSTRSSASSMAAVRGASVKDIMDRGLWKESSTWQRFYNKSVQDSPPSVFILPY